MSIEKAVQERWLSYVPLAELVPSESLITGQLYDEQAFPYVSLTQEGESPNWRSSDSESTDTLLRFTIVDESLSRARKIAGRIKDRFNRQSFSISGGVCYVMQWTNELRFRGDDGVWTVLADYSCQQAA